MLNEKQKEKLIELFERQEICSSYFSCQELGFKCPHQKLEDENKNIPFYSCDRWEKEGNISNFKNYCHKKWLEWFENLT